MELVKPNNDQLRISAIAAAYSLLAEVSRLLSEGKYILANRKLDMAHQLLGKTPLN